MMCAIKRLVSGAIATLFGMLIGVGILTTYFYFFGQEWELCHLSHYELNCWMSSEKDGERIESLISPPPMGKISCAKGGALLSGIDFQDSGLLTAVLDSARKTCDARPE